MTQLVLIAAVARNGMIGKDGGMPWHLPADLQHFKRLTLGHPILMGRRTWDSLGRPLPGRRNIVISRQPGWQAAGAEHAESLPAALQRVSDDVSNDALAFVIGGAQLYAQALPLVDRLELTEIDYDFDGDTRFPDWDRSRFTETARESHLAPEGWAYHFVTYTAKTASTV
ncbi:dihydrofolate reductase [Thiomonas arsenitoxydans]|uniref:dihydrofolate reductase n=1 Tax=Thiomonas arsenitoxydans (strain DSM 22701 / CIP 110005 / 3As) TaxID=426114 RepID=UPI001ACB8CC1|nr:dihydrofolate reductase [Thiomonas arsenitoxydans]MBN8775986.1 dihydrofolate reductase [Thiomonas arsenitoxydans]